MVAADARPSVVGARLVAAGGAGSRGRRGRQERQRWMGERGEERQWLQGAQEGE